MITLAELIEIAKKYEPSKEEMEEMFKRAEEVQKKLDKISPVYY